MFWEYIAGLFDGEGHVSIALSHHGKIYPSVSITVRITNSDGESLLLIKDFLNKNKVVSFISKYAIGTKKKGEYRTRDIYHLYIGSTEGVTLFCKNISPYSLIKKRQIEIALEAVALKKTLWENNQCVKDNLDLFDKFRHELHKLAHKGRKTLKIWPLHGQTW